MFLPYDLTKTEQDRTLLRHTEPIEVLLLDKTFGIMSIIMFNLALTKASLIHAMI